MKNSRKLDLLNKINVEVARILCTQSIQVIREWWNKPNTLFAPTPLEFSIERGPDGLKEMLHYYKNLKAY